MFTRLLITHTPRCAVRQSGQTGCGGTSSAPEPKKLADTEPDYISFFDWALREAAAGSGLSFGRPAAI